jgi:FMN phosphatase YigB (HAD superfamily)
MRRSHARRRSPWEDHELLDTVAGLRPGRRGVILDFDETLFPREQFATSGLAPVARHLPSITLHRSVADALHTMRVAGWRVCILTHGLPSVQFRKVAALRLTALVDEVVYAEEHASGPGTGGGAFAAALSALDLTANRCIRVSDDLAPRDRAARVLGIRTIRVASPGVVIHAHDEVDMIVDSVSELPRAAAQVLGMATANVA